MSRISAVLCSVVLVLPAGVHARKPVPVDDGPRTDELTVNAEGHVVKAITLAKQSAYGDAEKSLMRAAYFSPKWRPLHFNLGVLAEAQGNVGVAIREYQAFRPYATPAEAMLVDQRIDELGQRRQRVARTYHRQMAIGATITSLSLLGVAGGGALLGLYYRDKDSASARPSSYAVGGFLMILYVGLFAIAGGSILARAVKSKRQLDGLALGPTRLRWQGDSVRLRF